ncbi:hypothetical protein ACXET9_07300 [Brachybacterium sp. DNPG3]
MTPEDTTHDIPLTDDQAPDYGTSADEFDLEAWIDDGTRPRRDVTIYRDWSLLAEYERLAEQLKDEQDDADEAMGDTSITTQMQDIIDRIDASRLVFTIQQVTVDERKALAEKAPVKPVLDSAGEPVKDARGIPRTRVDEIALGNMVTASAVVGMVEPSSGKRKSTISAKQLERMRLTLGDGPLQSLYRGVAELNDKGAVLPSIPSSREH